MEASSPAAKLQHCLFLVCNTKAEKSSDSDSFHTCHRGVESGYNVEATGQQNNIKNTANEYSSRALLCSMLPD